MASASAPVPAPLPLGSQSPLANHYDQIDPPPFDYQEKSSDRENLPPFQFPAVQTMPSSPTAAAPMMPPPGFQHGRQASRSRRAPSLPEFSFNPGANLKPDPSPSPTHPILEEMASNFDSAKSAKAVTLPAFSFNPGANTVLKSQASSSPTKSSFGEMRAGGHRRRGSEFVGEGTPITSPSSFSTSPAKGEGGASIGPPISSLGPPSSKRHSHRRSEAVSISDVEKSNIIKESAILKHRAGSAPSTPADAKQFFDDEDSPPRSAASSGGFLGKSPPISPSRRQNVQGTPRPRVGFSETVDLIPRPLSLISSETEDSASTIRYSHSLTNSINSLGGISSPSKSRSSLSLSAGENSPRTRPKTADAASPSWTEGHKKDSFEDALSSHRCSVASMLDTATGPSNEASPSKQKRFWSGNNSPEEVSPKTTPAHELADPIFESTPSWTIDAASDPPRPRTSPERQASIKKRKVRSLTTGIFSRKAKTRSPKTKGRRTPTPPLPLSRSVPDAIFDEDNTVVIRESPPRLNSRPSAPALLTSNIAPLTISSRQDEVDIASPVIDLDAALGPFGSEEMIPQTGFAAARARLHSGGIRSTTDAFGNLHRRAESAPHLPPPNKTILAMHRYGSNSSMGVDEVFDEEEEDDYLAGKTPKRPAPIRTDSRSESPRIRISDASEHSPTDSSEESEQFGFPETESELKAPVTRTSDSTVTESDFVEPLAIRPVSVPIDFAYQSSPISYASSGDFQSAPNSAISFADTDSGYDSHIRQSRLRTDVHPSSRRLSTEDVPSLSDSVSTATGVHPRVSGSVHTRSSTEQPTKRSFSESAPVALSSARASKRASLASLSRLIPGSSHGEKSKLRFGESATDLDQQRLPAAKKSNRISRMMHFWRPKNK